MSDNAKAILWALIAAALYAGVAALAKLAVQDYHVLQILFVRQGVVLASSLPGTVRSFPAGLRTRRPGLHLVRLGGAFIALTCGIWAVAVLPLTVATTLAFAQVFFVALLARVFLAEQVGWHRLSAVIAGFVGVIVVMRPGVEGVVALHALIPILGALGAAAAITAVRSLSQTETTATLLLYQALFVGALSGVPLFWLWQTPDLAGWCLLLVMGGMSALGQWLGVRALRLGEASVVGPIEYSKLIYATVLGFVVFHELPDGYTLLGAAIIVGASLYILHREARWRARG